VVALVVVVLDERRASAINRVHLSSALCWSREAINRTSKRTSYRPYLVQI
jgi:hypothetical protein